MFGSIMDAIVACLEQFEMTLVQHTIENINYNELEPLESSCIVFVSFERMLKFRKIMTYETSSSSSLSSLSSVGSITMVPNQR